jgi:hypothetical protein
MFLRFGKLYDALKFGFPDIEWDPEKFLMKQKRSSQRYMKIKSSRTKMERKLTKC